MIRVMTVEEAMKEFEAEVERLQEQEAQLQNKYQSGQWALDPLYRGAR